MKILEIRINGHKVLKENYLALNDEQVFPIGSQILGIIGPNGSGKTTLCSMISWVFQSIFTRKKLDFIMNIKFRYRGSIRLIEYNHYDAKLFIDGQPYYEFRLNSKLNSIEAEIHTERIRNFWDGKIILSTFETNGEYPNKKPHNYSGRDPLVKYDIAGLYGKNSYNYPSITNGIIRFLNNSSKQHIATIFLEQMGFQLSGKVDLKIVRDIGDYQSYYHERGILDSTDKKIEESSYYKELKEKEEKSIGYILSEKIKKDKRFNLTSESQSLSFSTVLEISNDYSEYIGKYIFLNGLRLIKDDIELSFDNLSSGEKFLIMRYISILSGLENNSIVIIEEPENHLNPKWRELVIPALHKATTEFNSVLIFTTHDYRIVRYLHNNCVLNIGKGLVYKMKSLTLLCDEFDFESLNEKTIPFVYKDLKKTYDTISQEKKAELLNSMCNVEEKFLLRKQFLQGYEKS